MTVRKLPVFLLIFSSIFSQRLAVAQAPRLPWAPGEQKAQQDFEKYQNNGDFANAEVAGTKLVWIAQKYRGREHPDTAMRLTQLALFHSIHTGGHEKATPYYQEAISILKKHFGHDHQNLAYPLMNLAENYRTRGFYADAEPIYAEALRVAENRLGPGHMATSTILHNFANLYVNTGDSAKAELYYLRSIRIKEEQQMGLANPELAMTYGNLASVYYKSGQYQKSEWYNMVALKIRKKLGITDSPDLAFNYSNLANVYLATGKFSEAEPLFREAIRIYEFKGDVSPYMAFPFHGLGEIYFSRGDYGNARANFDRALEIRETQLGLTHPDTAKTLTYLALVSYLGAAPKEAVGFARRSSEAKLKNLENVLTFTTERERFAFLRGAEPYDILATLKAGEETANAILAYKGIVLESILEDRRMLKALSSPALEASVKRLDELKSRLKPVLVNTQSRKQNLTGITAGKLEFEKIEKSLARSISGFGNTRGSLSITYRQVALRLPNDMALLEFIRYRNHFDKKNDWYGVVVIRRDRKPKFVSLGPANSVESEITAFREEIAKVAYGESNNEEIERRSKILDKLLINGLQAHLVGINKLIVCPDAALNFLPFASLLDQNNRFLAQRFSVYYVASGRDLIAKVVPSDRQTGAPVIIGNPNFEMVNNPPGNVADPKEPQGAFLLALRSGFRSENGKIQLAPLPGTGIEVTRIKEVIETNSTGKNEVITLSGDAVTEQAVRNLEAPVIVHLATHGFFMEDTCHSGAESISGHFQNPMFRSGIALSGANDTFTAWNQNKVPDMENDGILLAAEVSALNLSGTQLVTLSACNTAMGDIVSGEGILGMRRAFVMAGARNVMMTLWEILDDPTPEFMDDFYRRYLKIGNAPEALAQVQREWLMRLRKESGTGAAIYIAGGFVMSAQAQSESLPR
ncbi:MAG: CHAT domain-containing protein [Verrucomicrobiales bacterium]|nr:CHAT domain-containing protein [Verrucomicrobiales bacterium]